jgi:hypothetical protein
MPLSSAQYCLIEDLQRVRQFAPKIKLLDIVWINVRNEVLLRVKEQRSILHEKINGWLTGLVTFCVETVFYDRLLEER